MEFKGVHKSFGKLTVLDGVDLTVARGSSMVILGPSGSGKSVMLQHIVGLLRPDRGEVLFDGERIDQKPESQMDAVRTRIGYLFQLSALFDSMSVGENLEFPLREHTSLRRRDRAVRVAEALEMVGLAGLEGRRPAELSGGQQKRVALARAIILKPDLILYDEPTTGLDPVRADAINRLVRKLQAELGVTSIIVTHDLASAAHISDRVVLLLNGRLIADAPYDALERSTDPRVRGFLEGRSDAFGMEPDADVPGKAARTARISRKGKQPTEGTTP